MPDPIWDDLRLLDAETPDEHLHEVDKRPGPDALMQTLGMLRHLGDEEVSAAAIRRAAIVAHAAWKVDWTPPGEFGAWTNRLRAAQKRDMVRIVGVDPVGRLLWRTTHRGRIELDRYLEQHPAIIRT